MYKNNNHINMLNIIRMKMFSKDQSSNSDTSFREEHKLSKASKASKNGNDQLRQNLIGEKDIKVRTKGV